MNNLKPSIKFIMFKITFILFIVVVLSSTSRADQIGLLGWWKGEGNTNDAQNGNNGTLQNGATFFDIGNSGHAFSLDGLDDYISVPDAPILNPKNSITLAAWVFIKQYKTYPNSNNIIVKDDLNTNKRDYILQVGYFGIGDVASFDIFTSEGLNIYVSGGSVSSNAWHHIAGTYDGHILRLYIDGTLVASKAYQLPTYTTLNDTDTPLRIGATNDAPYNRYFNGLIDEVQIFNRALDSTEIQAIIRSKGNSTN